MMPRWVFRGLLLLALALVVLQILVPEDIRYPLFVLSVLIFLAGLAGRWPSNRPGGL